MNNYKLFILNCETTRESSDLLNNDRIYVCIARNTQMTRSKSNLSKSMLEKQHTGRQESSGTVPSLGGHLEALQRH